VGCGLTELFEPRFQLCLSSIQPRSENLAGFLVESPQLIDGHLFELLSVITDVQSPAPVGAGSTQVLRPDFSRSSKLIALVANQPGCLINRLFISFP
jgi:hypothetical protein